MVRATVDDALHYHEELVAAALDAIRACPVPTVAMIQGACIGGGAGDRRLLRHPHRRRIEPLRRADQQARFSMYPGEMAGLLNSSAPAVLLEILLEGRIPGAHEALAKGPADPRGGRRGGRARPSPPPAAS